MKLSPDEPGGDHAEMFRRLIRTHGPISLSRFMGESNASYYAGKDPLGADGDFVTAPEISQMFGELIGLWLADMWIAAGRPQPVHYVELGPGRGTLAKDALRSAGRYGLEPSVHLVEGSPVLREIQRAALGPVTFHGDLTGVPADGPLLLVANEFLDALPIRQLVRTAHGWRERMVGLHEDRLAFVAGDQPMDAAVPPEWQDAAEGTLIETCPAAAAVMHEIAARLAAQGGAALLIDYGHAQRRSGSTLQAVRGHRKVDPLDAPGAADLTAHVDFDTLDSIARTHDVRLLGTVPQGKWLTGLGIDMRAEALSRAAPHLAAQLQQDKQRLVADEEMGMLFKVMGLAGPGWPGGSGFPAD
ncbi:class I SAM-dependent methyltransferase [Allopontixanthobacter sediminis]|uniref:Class I SAM-dependent methyltransferase n=1 Tax=Allopontixanthobacter sediminis TaxID=1689985 RepID=A0A845B4A1_9SPHN|nr:SAM-dependent methyltransferase [Allopontixanthobacter sediminis]MXP44247.1 class I SAM-dependent methyltransferase [Allopontixanthobacter sediminis]